MEAADSQLNHVLALGAGLPHDLSRRRHEKLGMLVLWAEAFVCCAFTSCAGSMGARVHAPTPATVLPEDISLPQVAFEQNVAFFASHSSCLASTSFIRFKGMKVQQMSKEIAVWQQRGGKSAESLCTEHRRAALCTDGSRYAGMACTRARLYSSWDVDQSRRSTQLQVRVRVQAQAQSGFLLPRRR